jgi:hypothetical protein
MSPVLFRRNVWRAAEVANLRERHERAAREDHFLYYHLGA